MIAAHLAALQVVIPLLAAPICFLIGRWRIACWVLATAVAWICLAISLALAGQVAESGTIRYAFGGWDAPWGIEYVVDSLNVLVLIIVSGIAAIVLPYSWTSIQKELDEKHHALFFTSLLLCFAGLLGITITGDAFNLFVLLEISSLATYTLISLGRDRRALTASFQYLIMGTIGATFILISVGILYMLTGTLIMADLATRLPALGESRALQTAFGFMVVGVGLKLAMFPLHLWLPNAYAFAPSVVSAFVAATATKVAVYVLLRYLYTIFGASYSFGEMNIHWLFIIVGVTAALFTSIVALFQSDVKRMLAYSSVAQIGYMLIGIGLLNVSGLTATLMHLFNHALMKGTLFLAMGAVCYRLGNTLVSNMQGIGRQMPWTMAAFLVGGLSIVGVPLTGGFITKWYLILGAIENGMWIITAAALISSLIALMYIWRIVEITYLKPRPDDAPTLSEVPVTMLVPMWVLVLANIYFGIHAGPVIEIANRSAELLIGGGP